MDYYIDIKMKPDSEMRENVLMNKVYTKLHKALFSLNSTEIGVSFPKYERRLGGILRIHGYEDKLTTLQDLDWLDDLVDYCTVSALQPVPTEVMRYRTVSRKQSNMTQAKLRRLVKRGTISEADIKNYKAKMFKKGLSHPYLELLSSSTGQNHRRYIVFGDLLDNAIEGSFDHFGLSRTATIPWF
jgi:CRISPR-associated endonuclease Csy4